MRYDGIHACALAACSLGLTLAAAMSTTARAAGQGAPPPISFNRDIRPILSNNCFACHGPDEKQRETKFHFDTKEGAFAEDGIIVPGSAAGSMLVKRITNPDPKKRMPPPDSGHALTARQIELLRRWIDEGAKWDTHWAYTAPVRPDPPAVEKTDWVRNPIDRFILARLEREGLKPSPEADKATLLRRVTYDLTGLPPTPAELDAFLADRSPDAYETARRCAPAVAALRRAHGHAVARRRALRRHARLPHRQPSRDVAVARLGHRRLQPQPAVRPVHDRAARRRPAARRDARAEGGLGLQPQPHDQLRRRRDRRRVPGRVRHRSRRGDVDGVHGADDGVCALPLAQVRSDQPQGVLPVLRLLQ